MEFKSRDVVLLTGAGFTHNFGGYLAKDMWAMIFNNPLVQSQEKIRQLLLEDFDFESVYSKVIENDEYRREEKEAIETAVEQVYQKLDYILKNPVHTDGIDLANELTDPLTNLLVGNDDEKGIFFTLNQDLFIERKFDRFFHRPGINPTCTNGSSIILPQDCYVDKLKDEIANNKKKRIYVKLHGSYDWSSSKQGNAKVIGKNKIEYIEQEPLLKCYFQLFRDIIGEGNKKLLIIGYGFREKHINKVLLTGVKKYGLRLYVINPSDPYNFKQELFKSKYYAKPLWSAIHGYFPYTLKQILMPDSRGEISIDQIYRVLDL